MTNKKLEELIFAYGASAKEHMGEKFYQTADGHGYSCDKKMLLDLMEQAFERGKEEGYKRAWHDNDLDILYKEYGLADDRKLTEDAKKLKQKIMKFVNARKEEGRKLPPKRYTCCCVQDTKENYWHICMHHKEMIKAVCSGCPNSLIKEFETKIHMKNNERSQIAAELREIAKCHGCFKPKRYGHTISCTKYHDKLETLAKRIQ